MAEVTINGKAYEAFADIEFADDYLAADAARADAWDERDDDPDKARGLVSATRLLLRDVPWKDGPPDLTVPPEAVKQATALLAADILAKPALADKASTGSNVKRVSAEGTGVEFFRGDDSAVTPLPSAAWNLLLAAGLIGTGAGALEGGAFYSGGCQESRFTYDPEDRHRWDVC